MGDPGASGRRPMGDPGASGRRPMSDPGASRGRQLDASALQHSQLAASGQMAFVDRDGPTFIDRSEREPVDREVPTWRSSDGGVPPPLKQLVSESVPTPRVSAESLDRLADTLGAPRSSGMVGRTVDSFRILRLIAQGGMGAVYEAMDDQLQRKVALKTLLGGANAEKSEIDRFVREAHAASQLTHPNLVAVYRAGARDGVLYIAMELVSGETLHQLIRRSGFLDPHHAAEIIAKAARGLGHAHQHGILHRDMKPANVIVTPEGEVKVTDFGVAKVTGGESLTQSGIALGTPSYMSPEQALGYNDRLDERSDVYGLGAVLYECLTGRPPFHESSQLGTMEAVISEPAPPISLVRPDLDAQIVAICERCLQKDPKRRYETCATLERDLEAWLQGRTVAARAPRILSKLGRRARPLAPVLPAALILLLVMGYLLPRRGALRLANAERQASAALKDNLQLLEAALASGDAEALGELSAASLVETTRDQLLGSEAHDPRQVAAFDRGLASVAAERLNALRPREAEVRAAQLPAELDGLDESTRRTALIGWSRVAELHGEGAVGADARLKLARAALATGASGAAERELLRLTAREDGVAAAARELLLGRWVSARRFGRAHEVLLPGDPRRPLLQSVAGRWALDRPIELWPLLSHGAYSLFGFDEDGMPWQGTLGGQLLGAGAQVPAGTRLLSTGSWYVLLFRQGDAIQTQLHHSRGNGKQLGSYPGTQIGSADFDGQGLVFSTENGVYEIQTTTNVQNQLSKAPLAAVARLRDGGSSRSVWLNQKGQLRERASQVSRTLQTSSPCDRLRPAMFGTKRRGALAWASSPQSEGERAVFAVQANGKLTAWPVPPEASELIAWSTFTGDEPILVRQFRTDSGYRMEWCDLEEIGEEGTTQGVQLAGPAFERPPRVDDLDQDGTAEWLLPSEVYGPRLPRGPSGQPTGVSRVDRIQVALGLGLPLDECGLRLDEALEALARAELAFSASLGSSDSILMDEAAGEAARAWDLASEAQRAKLAPDASEILLGVGHAKEAEPILEARARAEGQGARAAERTWRACRALGDDGLVLSPDTKRLVATSPFSAYVSNGALVLRSDPNLFVGVGLPLVGEDVQSLRLDTTLLLEGAGDSPFLVGLLGADLRLRFGVRIDGNPRAPRVEFVCDEVLCALPRSAVQQRLRCSLTLLPSAAGGYYWSAELTDEAGKLLLRRRGTRPIAPDFNRLAAYSRSTTTTPPLAGNTLRVEALSIRGAGVIEGPYQHELYRAHGAWLLGRGDHAATAYAACEGPGAAFYARFADTTSSTTTHTRPSDLELRFFWRHLLGSPPNANLQALVRQGQTQLPEWVAAPPGMPNTTRDQATAFERLVADCVDGNAWKTLLARIESHAGDPANRVAQRIWLLRDRLHIARARGVEPGVEARLELATALCLYAPPQLAEAAALINELGDTQRSQVLDLVTRALESEQRTGAAQELAKLCR